MLTKSSLVSMQATTPRKKVTLGSGRQLTQVCAFDFHIAKKLPFNLLDENGFLLMPSGSVLQNKQTIEKMVERGCFADSKEHESYMAKLASAVDYLYAKNVCLLKWREVEDEFSDEDRDSFLESHTRVLTTANPFEAIDVTKGLIKPLLNSQNEALPHWLAKLDNVRTLFTWIMDQNPSAVLNYLIREYYNPNTDFSINHAMFCTAVCALVAKELKLSDMSIQRLSVAALTMNVSATHFHNQLKNQKLPPHETQQKKFSRHGRDSANILEERGVDDEELLYLVRNHHAPVAEAMASAELTDESKKLMLILQSVDSIGEKISPSGHKQAMLSASVAKEIYASCGAIDKQVGLAVVKAFGMYPPGTFVKLASGETALVIAPGPKPTEPQVVTVANKEGMMCDMRARSTNSPQFSIVEGIESAKVKITVNSEKVASFYLK